MSTCACLIELKTEFELEQVIPMQLRNKITVARKVRIHPLSLLNRKAHNAVVFRLEDADEMVKTTLKQLGKRFHSFSMASDLYLNIWRFWNTELQRVQVNQCQLCVV